MGGWDGGPGGHHKGQPYLGSVVLSPGVPIVVPVPVRVLELSVQVLVEDGDGERLDLAVVMDVLPHPVGYVPPEDGPGDALVTP